MSALLKSAAHAQVSGGHFRDVDALAAQFHGYDQQYQQLSGGPFEGRIQRVQFGSGLGIQFEMANRELAQAASTPAGCHGACVQAESSPECTLNAAIFAQDDLVLCPALKCLEGKTPEGVGMYCMDIDQALLPEEVRERSRVGMATDPAGARRLRDLVHSGMAAFSTRPALADYPVAVASFRASVVDLVWQIATRPTGSDPQGPRHRRSARTLRVFRRARDHIRQHLADGITIAELCRQTGVSRRSLECAFQAVVGTGPGNYVRMLQLNHIRRDLKSAGDQHSIGHIAAKHGVWHLSRFSSYYRELFGELPSQTRRGHAGSALSG